LARANGTSDGFPTSIWSPSNGSTVALCPFFLCVSVWCFAKYSDKREAADYHLGYLKERFG
jgi:hypothetical protein